MPEEVEHWYKWNTSHEYTPNPDSDLAKAAAGGKGPKAAGESPAKKKIPFTYKSFQEMMNAIPRGLREQIDPGGTEKRRKQELEHIPGSTQDRGPA